MLQYLMFVGLLGQVGITRTPSGDVIDFGPGATCMLHLPAGFVVDPRRTDFNGVRFRKGEDFDKTSVSGTARVLDDQVMESREKGEKGDLVKYKNALIERVPPAGETSRLFGFEVVIGRQSVRFWSETESALPTPEEIVDSCGSANQ